MECFNVAGAGDVASRNKGGAELAAIALEWLTLDGFILRLLKFGPTNVLRKVSWLVEQNNWMAGKRNAYAFRRVEDRQRFL